MDIGQYENAKFELADILRAALLAARAAQPENIYPFDELFARLAEDRFNVVVAGQFSRGKTSLVNAMLNTERLSTGIIPLTSVITTVQYGTAERVTMEYNERRLPFEIPIESLSEYITQRHNPGNVQGIRLARIELPSEILRRGFYLIDTPGLGSAIVKYRRPTMAPSRPSGPASSSGKLPTASVPSGAPSSMPTSAPSSKPPDAAPSIRSRQSA